MKKIYLNLSRISLTLLLILISSRSYSQVIPPINVGGGTTITIGVGQGWVPSRTTPMIKVKFTGIRITIKFNRMSLPDNSPDNSNEKEVELKYSSIDEALLDPDFPEDEKASLYEVSPKFTKISLAMKKLNQVSIEEATKRGGNSESEDEANLKKAQEVIEEILKEDSSLK
jgi:hypothetical protein